MLSDAPNGRLEGPAAVSGVKGGGAVAMSATSSTRLSPSPNLLQVNEPKRYGSTLSLEEKCEQSFFLFYYYRMEDEAVLDRGASLLKHMCDQEEVEGERLPLALLTN